MRILFIIPILTLFYTCSFDNKTGIWQNENKKISKKDSLFEDFKKIDISKGKEFNQITNLKKNFKFKKVPTIKTSEWKDIFYSKENTIDNFQFSGNYKVNFKSKKLSKYELSNRILYIEDFFITSDTKGNLITYSINQKKILKKYNFYKKKIKNIKIFLNYLAKDNILYVTDNLGYVYAYDYKTNLILWAKKFKVPIRSNLKIFQKKLFAVDQNNYLIIIDINDGKILKQFPTEEILYKNDFQNNLALGKENIFLLNTFGTLYSINVNNLKINWFLNLNSSLDQDLGNLFYAKTIKIMNNRLIISTNNNFFIIDKLSGSYIFSSPIKSLVDPIKYGNNVFLLNNNNLLIALDITDGKIIYSKFIEKEILSLLKLKKDKLKIRSIKLINNELSIFLDNSIIVTYNVRGKIKKANFLDTKISSNIIFFNNNILFLDNKNKLVKLD